jgi:serine/threonine-protein kinase
MSDPVHGDGSVLPSDASAAPSSRPGRAGEGDRPPDRAATAAQTPTLAPAPTRDEESPTAPRGLKAPSVAVPAQAGRYEILGEIASGGMGVVLYGRDGELGRDLAVKVLNASAGAQARLRERFLQEARVQGRLQHPGVVPVYELGRFADGRPFFAMKLVKGRTLSALLRDRPGPAQDLPRFVHVFEQVCQALAYAHSRGIIHRDLKPSNVMVGAFGEVQVMDWGLAKILAEPGTESVGPAASPFEGTHMQDLRPAPEEAGGQVTQAGAVMGTAAYMAPEQARGEVERLDERCDVFGLGAILCQILGGEPPYTGASSAEVLRKAQTAQLDEARVRLDASGADVELVRLTRQCLAPEPHERPRDAGAVAQAIAAYLAGVQERLRAAEVERAAAEAREAAAQARARAERRARRLTVGLALVLLGLGLLAGGGGWWYARQRDLGSAAVREALQKAKRLEELARSAGGDRLQWSEAVAAYKEAHALALAGSCTEELRQRAAAELASAAGGERQARRRADADARHQQMLARLEDMRLQVTELYEEDRGGFARVARAYEHTLRQWDLDIDRLKPAEAADRLRAYPVPLTRALAGALDQWVTADWSAYWNSWVGGRDKPGLLGLAPLRQADQPGLVARLALWRHRLAVAQLADPDPLRDRLRRAVVTFDFDDFKRLVRDVDTTNLPADTLQIMAMILHHLREEVQAVDMLRKASAAHPDDYWLHELLALFCTHLRPQDWEEAARQHSAAAAIRPRRWSSLHNLGFALEVLGKVDSAVLAYERALQLAPGDAFAHFHLAGLLNSKGDLDRALSHAREAARLRPGEEFMHQSLGTLLWQKGVHAEALRTFQAATRANPKSGASLAWVGRCLCRLDRPAEALAPFRAAIQIEPKNAAYRHALGAALAQLGRGDAALAVYREAVQAVPDDAGSRLVLGRELFKTRKVDEALSELRQAARLQPDSSEAQDLLATALAAKGDRAGSAAALRELHRLRPGDPAVRSRLAAALRELGLEQYGRGDTEGALVNCRTSVDLQADPDALKVVGIVLEMKGRHGEAADALRRCLRLRGEDVEAWCRLGWVCQQQDRRDEMERVFRKAVELQPFASETHHGLGRSLLLREDLKAAVASLREAVRLDAQNYWALCDYAEALRRRGALARAEAACRQALALRPDDALAYRQLGQALAGQGKLAEALAVSQEGMRKGFAFETAHQIAELFIRKGDVGEALAYLTDPLEPGVMVTHQSYTGLLALAGKGAGYRTACAALLKRYRRTVDEHHAFAAARSLTQAPGAGTDPAEAVRLAERAVKVRPQFGWFRHALALAYLRAGQADRAVREAQEALKVGPGWHPPLDWLVLSLAHHRLGQAGEARRWLEQVQQAGPPAGMVATDAVCYQLLRREAEALVGGVK